MGQGSRYPLLKANLQSAPCPVNRLLVPFVAMIPASLPFLVKCFVALGMASAAGTEPVCEGCSANLEKEESESSLLSLRSQRIDGIRRSVGVAPTPSTYPSPATPQNSSLAAPAANTSAARLANASASDASSDTNGSTKLANSSSNSDANSSIGPTLLPLQNLTKSEAKAQAKVRAAAELDCIVSVWSEWSSCIRHKMDGLKSFVRIRTRDIVQPQQEGGAACATLWEQRLCRTQ